jgi:hypothetical protein
MTTGLAHPARGDSSVPVIGLEDLEIDLAD